MWIIATGSGERLLDNRPDFHSALSVSHDWINFLDGDDILLINSDWDDGSDKSEVWMVGPDLTRGGNFARRLP